MSSTAASSNQNSEWSNQGLESTIFGGTPTANECVQDLRVRLPLLWFETNRKELTKLQIRRYQILLRAASENLDALASKSILPSLAHDEIQTLRSGISMTMSFGLIGGSSSQWTEAMLEHVDTEVVEIWSERGEFKRELAGATRLLEPTFAHDFRDIIKDLESALSSENSDRLLVLRECRQGLQSLVLELSESTPAAMLFAQGWIAWYMNRAAPDLLGIFDASIRRAGGFPSITSHFASRLMADILFEREDYGEAFHIGSQSLKSKPSASAYLELAKLALFANRDQDALKLIGAALEVRPYYAINVLADERFCVFGDELLKCIAATQLKTRQIAAFAMTQFQAKAKVVAEAMNVAEKESKVSRDFSLEFDEHKIAKADVIVGSFFAQIASEAARGIYKKAGDVLTRERNDREARLNNVKRLMEECWDKRQRAVAIAKEGEIARSKSANVAIVASDQEGERIQKGCFTSLFSGCGFFALYVIGATALSIKGIMLDLFTPVGFLFLAVAISPAAVCIILQIAYGIRRMAVEAEVSGVLRGIQNVYDTAVAEADAIYKKEIAQLKEALEAAESSIEKVNQALSILKEEVAKAA